MNGGWYKHYRNLFERPWAKDAKMVSLYEYLHCCAYVQDQPLRDRDIMIRRGSCLTSRAAIMEGTGLSEHDVKSRLRKLLDYGEIIVKTSNVGTIVTVCDYDSNNDSEDLFMFNSSSESPNGLPSGSPSESPTDKEYKKEEYNNINLRSHCIPSKMERENKKAVTEEIRQQFNRTLGGMLKQWQRVTDKMVNKVAICIARFGRQSIDMVFEQISHELTNLNSNGFMPDFDFIFRIEQYEKYLSRYEMRMKKQAAPRQAVGVIEADDEPDTQSREEYERSMREYAAQHPDSRQARIVAEWDRKEKK